jgi:hypothetical protein
MTGRVERPDFALLRAQYDISTQRTEVERDMLAVINYAGALERELAELKNLARLAQSVNWYLIEGDANSPCENEVYGKDQMVVDLKPCDPGGDGYRCEFHGPKFREYATDSDGATKRTLYGEFVDALVALERGGGE